MKGIPFADLEAVVKFMYSGFVNVTKDRLSSFLETAKLLQIKGLADEDSNAPEARPYVASSAAPVVANLVNVSFHFT